MLAMKERQADERKEIVKRHFHLFFQNYFQTILNRTLYLIPLVVNLERELSHINTPIILLVHCHEPPYSSHEISIFGII